VLGVLELACGQMLQFCVFVCIFQAEALGCEGNVDQAQKVTVLCDQMRDERTTLLGVSCTLNLSAFIYTTLQLHTKLDLLNYFQQQRGQFEVYCLFVCLSLSW